YEFSDDLDVVGDG
nr:Chain C, KAT8 REGULATORY NSL COMPLEX SUBUNIT 2 [Homo sapiens]